MFLQVDKENEAARALTSRVLETEILEGVDGEL